MKTITELRKDLLDVYVQTKAKKIDLPIAAELANNAGKIIKTAALELAYNQFTGQQDKHIDFLQGETELKIKKAIFKDNHNPYKAIEEINAGK